jgi:chromate transporter
VADTQVKRHPSDAPPTLARLFLVFLRLGAVAFGGPAMVAHIRGVAVERRRWLRPQDFHEGVSLCQAIPGATAMQCAAFVGLRCRGLAGAAAAFAGFGLPAFLLMLLLSLAYSRAMQLPAVLAALTGLRLIVVALVAHAAWGFGRTALRGWRDAAIAAAAASLFLLRVHPVLILLGAAATGLLTTNPAGGAPPPPVDGRRPVAALRAPLLLVVGALALGWLLHVLQPRLAALALSMVKVDLVAFGGGFASVPLMLREVVDYRGWLPAAVFMDGITLGQITPGPIVITATFVGQQVAGLAGAAVATAGIFLPSFVVLALVEPWFRRLNSRPAFRGATHALVLSFVGLLVSATIQFARLAPWSPAGALLAAAAFLLLLRKVDVAWIVVGGGILSALLA